ncbi:MAG: formylmethanofuran--tetrahydromethanopterin N-formyltransferase [Planctomycetota bacterium]
MGPRVDSTYAEAFTMRATRLIITAHDDAFVRLAAQNFCGHSSSVIGCELEAGVERFVPASETPDNRPGVSLLAFATSRKGLEAQVTLRVGQNVLTCPTTACYGGMDSERSENIKLGAQLRYFGDGFQIAKKLGNRRFWRVPVMDGEFVIDDVTGTCKGIGGGNLIVTGRKANAIVPAMRRAVAAIDKIPGAITPFPTGIVRSGSKVGSKYPKLSASTNHKWCPTLKGFRETEMTDEENAAYEIVIDGIDEEAVAAAMKAAMRSLLDEDEVIRISAGNYGGALGKHHFHLQELMAQ